MNNYGLNDDYFYQEVLLDSLDATTTAEPGQTSLNNPLFIFARPFRNICAIKILSAQVPYTYYAITQYNYSFVLTEDALSVTITLPIGNYSPNSMAETLATVLSTQSPHGYVYIVNYSAQTNNLSITNSTGGPAAVFSLVFGNSNDTGNTNPRVSLGFGPGTNTSSAINNLQTLISGAVQFGANYLYLNSDSVGFLVKTYLPLGAKNLNNGDIGPQLALIDAVANPNGVIFYNDPDPQKWFSMEVFNLSSIDLYFTAGNTSQVVDFNGQPFSVKIGILIQNPNRATTQGATYAQGRVQTRVVPQ